MHPQPLPGAPDVAGEPVIDLGRRSALMENQALSELSVSDKPFPYGRRSMERESDSDWRRCENLSDHAILEIQLQGGPGAVDPSWFACGA